jgi:hypothetical protein
MFLDTIYQNGEKIKLPLNYQNGPKIYQITVMGVKCTNTFQSKALQNFPKLGYLV